MEKFIGVDIGGTNVKFGIVSEDGKLLHKQKHKTLKLRKGDFLKNFGDALAEEITRAEVADKIGIGVPGTISKDRTTTLELPNLPNLNKVNFIGYLKQRFPNFSFHIENDANAAALGEYYFSKSTTPESFIFITLGTGVGGGAVIDGEIFKGANGNAMEIGHIISSNGKSVEENIGKKGILGLALTTLEGYTGKSVLSALHDLNSKKVVKAAHDNDKLALDIFKEVGVYLGDAIVSTIRLLDIHSVIIGGGVSETFDYVQASMYKVIYSHLTPYYLNDLKIQLATLGNNAGIIGAASLCFIKD